MGALNACLQRGFVARIGRAAVLLPLLVACGARLPSTLDPGRAGRAPAGQVEAPLSGALSVTDGRTLDLGQVAEPLVLMFAAYTCRSCRAEARDLVAFFRTKPGLPTNAKLVTVLVGASREVAERWKSVVCPAPEAALEGACVPWEVATDPGDPLFRARCPEGLTPCVLTQRRGATTKVVRRVGETPISDLEKETGPWTY